jgi:putative membrane protein
MSQPAPKAPLQDDKKATEHLANERTFLAWIRTSIAIISLGFVVAKFSVWLGELASHFQPGAPPARTGASLPVGLAMMALGAIFAALAARRYHKVTRDIERGLVLFVTIAVILLTIVMTVFMILSADKL